MTRFDRYLLRTITATSLIALAFLLAVDYIVQISVDADDLGQGNYTLAILLLQLLLVLPEKLLLYTPAAVLIGTIMGLGQLAAQNEIAVVRAAGISRLRLARAGIAFALIVGVLNIVNGETLAPQLADRSRLLRNQALGQSSDPGREQGIWLKQQNTIIHIGALNADGSGSFRDYVAAFIAAAADAELQKGADPAALQAENPWLTIDGKRVKNVDFAAYAKAMGRQKTPPAFDALDLSSGENQLFGDEHQDTRHFTAYSAANSAVKGAGSAGAVAVKKMNPLSYISEKTVPQHWRIRVGTNDRDTSLAVSAVLAAKLQNNGQTVDYTLPWDVGHGGDYDLDELFAWMKQVSSSAK